MTLHNPTELDRLCIELEITIEAKHVALRSREPDGKKSEWPKDEWSVTLSYQGKTHVSPFYTGIGLREVDRNRARFERGFYTGGAGAKDPDTRDTLTAAERGWTKPKAPNAADVLSCLANEADALEYSFDDWCSNLGENNDSIKARDTYLACQKTGDALLRMFGKEVLDKLRAAEH